MIRFVFCLVLACGLASAAGAAAPLTLTLPSGDSYCYWVQSGSGPVTLLPVSVTGHRTVRIVKPITPGDRLFVLDAHTGEVASSPVALGPDKVPAPVTLTLADFHAVAAPAPPPASVPAGRAEADAPPKPSAATRLVTDLLSLILAGGVGWVVVKLVQTRGEPLRQLARRAGVEVADPKPLAEEPPEEVPVYAPARRAPAAVPDEAGLPPGLPGPHLARGPEIALADVPALLGLQGLAAGSTFALSAGDVTIGRDGENEIVLAENTVSRRHARLLRDGRGRITLTDLGSANGVYVNGMRVQRAVLCHGDEVKVGDNYFRFQAAREP